MRYGSHWLIIAFVVVVLKSGVMQQVVGMHSERYLRYNLVARNVSLRKFCRGVPAPESWGQNTAPNLGKISDDLDPAGNLLPARSGPGVQVTRSPSVRASRNSGPAALKAWKSE